MKTLRTSALRPWALFVMIALPVVALSAAQAPTANSARPCRVVNATQQKHFPPDRGEALTAAIASANAGDELEITGICTGTYTLNQDIVLTGVSTKQFPIPTLDGGQAGSTLTVVTSVTAALTNVTITGGTGQRDPVNPEFPGDAGGILNRGNLTLISCAVLGNRAPRNGNGGGIWTIGSIILEGGSVVSGNVASNDGGGIYGFGTITIRESSTVSGNIATDLGGGILNGGALTIDASSVTGNRSNLRGGGILNGGEVTLQNSSSVSDNRTAFDGGGIWNLGLLIVNSSTLSGNAGTGSGGGILNHGQGVVTLNSSTVIGNASGLGGGIYNDTGTVTLNSSLVTKNTAFVAGGGIYNEVGAVVNLDGSVVTENTPDNCVGVPGC